MVLNREALELQLAALQQTYDALDFDARQTVKACPECYEIACLCPSPRPKAWPILYVIRRIEGRITYG